MKSIYDELEYQIAILEDTRQYADDISPAELRGTCRSIKEALERVLRDIQSAPETEETR